MFSRRLALSSGQSLFSHCYFPSARVFMTKHHRGFNRFTRSVFPSL